LEELGQGGATGPAREPYDDFFILNSGWVCGRKEPEEELARGCVGGVDGEEAGVGFANVKADFRDGGAVDCEA